MDKKFVGLFSLFFLVFTLFAVLVLARNPLGRFTQATEDKQPSASSSVLLAWPLTVNLKSQSTITVFVRSVSNKPIANKVVTFSSSIGSLQKATGTSDDTGKFETQLSCNKVGIAEIQAVIDNTTPIDQKITVECK